MGVSMLTHTFPCGSVLLLDDADESLLALPWRVLPYRAGHGGPYAYAPRKSGNIFVHRLLLGDMPGMVIDHIDGNGMNNVRANLRHCTPAQNAQNSRIRVHSSSGLKGVMFESCGGGYRRWRATVVCAGKRHRQYFDTSEQADAWARAKREELHGPFARHD